MVFNGCKHLITHLFFRDEKKAVEIYLEVADADPPNAATLCQLGICFLFGLGVTADAARAVQYHERAVSMG